MEGLSATALQYWGTSFDTSYDVSAPGGNSAAAVAADTESSGNDGWGDFWRTTAQNVIGYAIARDAARNGVAVQQPMGNGAVAPVYVPQSQATMGVPPVLLLAGVGLLAYLAIKN